MPASIPYTRIHRLEVRTTEEACAADAVDIDLSTLATREPLADRDHFTLSAEALAEWERINRRPERELPGLRRLMQRASPFSS